MRFSDSFSIEPEGSGGAEPAQRLLDFLSEPASYLEGTERVELRETHISWVFLTDAQVYKLKKPVRFEFVDFSTLEARRRACDDEVRLNRRLAPDVYLEVLPITDEGQERLALGGAGRPVEWAVKMRRLPADRMLDELIRARRLTRGDIDSLAALLARFYREAEPLPIAAEEYRGGVERHVRANLELLSSPGLDLAGGLVRRVHHAQLRLLLCYPELLDARAGGRRIVDGHGDLRPEHICLEAAPVVFDCVEFSADLRRIDVIDELSFLAVECDLLDAPEVGRTLIDRYRAASGDRPPPPLLHFYRAYRACVRAKVAALRARQAGGPERDADLRQAERYLRLADDERTKFCRPLLLVVRGLMGTGKSTLARGLAESLGMELIATDAVRRELLGASPEASGFGEGHYAAERIDQVYREMFRRAGGLLVRGTSVILDGSFTAARHREQAAALAAAQQAGWLIARCHCRDEEARRRIAARQASGGDPSEARPELLTQQRKAEQPDLPGIESLPINTEASLDEQQRLVRQAIRELLPLGAPD
ncbi:MAG: AAA family ATPase, partial [Pirellulales bacterium]